MSNIFLKLNKIDKGTKGLKINHLFIGIGVTSITSTVSESILFLDNTSQINSTTTPILKLGYEFKSSNPRFTFFNP
jgi:hypothetical protein